MRQWLMNKPGKSGTEAFRLLPEESVKLDSLLQIAYLAGRLKEPTLQAYIMYALNLADTDLRKATGH